MCSDIVVVSATETLRQYTAEKMQVGKLQLLLVH